MQILGQVAQCLSDLHARGWVHRDLKPGNIIFLPSRGKWTLIDFGLAARVGETPPRGHTPGYAPPEVIAAHDADADPLVADPATDAWALGVMAFELLTGQPAFDWLTGSKQVSPSPSRRPTVNPTTGAPASNPACSPTPSPARCAGSVTRTDLCGRCPARSRGESAAAGYRRRSAAIRIGTAAPPPYHT